jgi:hypothetical protein
VHSGIRKTNFYTEIRGEKDAEGYPDKKCWDHSRQESSRIYYKPEVSLDSCPLGQNKMKSANFLKKKMKVDFNGSSS